MSDDRLVAGRYRLLDQIGSGGMGVVWRARDERLERDVAVKTLHLPSSLTGPQTAEAKQQAMREGRIAARVQHPSLISVYDVAEDGEQLCLIMEYLPSKSLSTVLAERGTLSPREVADIGAQAAAGLAAAHTAGIVHRDVKPGNVLLGHQGTVKITDFGISRAVEDAAVTSTGIITGTPAYLSPEVAIGKRASFASDVFSLGATLYAALEGAPPFGTSDNALALLHRVAAGQVEPPRNAGPLTGLLLQLLRADPDARPTMAQARDVLAAAARGEGTAATAVVGGAAAAPTLVNQPTPPPRPAPTPTRAGMAAAPPPTGSQRISAWPERRPAPPPPPRDRKAAWLVALGVVLLALASFLVWQQFRDDDPGTANPGGPSLTSEQPAATTTAEQPAPTTQPQTTTQPPTTTPPPTTTSQPPPPDADAAQVAAITDYYAIMPGDTETGWTRLSDNFKQSRGQTYERYQNFWSRFSEVEASDVEAGDGDTVTATVTFTENGVTSSESHTYTLVEQNGQWLIDQQS